MRRIAIAAVLVVDLAVLVATSQAGFDTFSDPSEPVPIELGPESPTASFDVEVTVGRAFRGSSVTLQIDLTGDNVAPSSGFVSVSDITKNGEPGEEAVAVGVMGGALGGVAEPVQLRLEVPIDEIGTTSHHLLLSLEGEADFVGEAVLTVRASDHSAPEGDTTLLVEVR